MATASYTDPSGAKIDTMSNEVRIIVAAIAGVQVTPDETTPTINFGPLEDRSRSFNICNSGNVANTFTVTRRQNRRTRDDSESLYDVNNDGLVDAGDTLVTIGTTQTPVLQPGQCFSVLVSFNTGAAQVGTTQTINLTATTVTPGVGGNSTDGGQRLYGMLEGPRISDPRDPEQTAGQDNQRKYVGRSAQWENPNDGRHRTRILVIHHVQE